MTFDLAIYAFKASLVMWLVLLMALVVGRMLSGTTSCRGILADNPARAGTETSATRAVAMLVFPLVIMFLIVEALNYDPTAVAAGARPTFPDIPDNLVMLLTGGNGVYLAGKLSAQR